MIFGYQDNDNFYEFAYSRDGFVMLGRTVDGEFETLVDWIPSVAVKQGDVTNEVQVIIGHSPFGTPVEDAFLSARLNGREVIGTFLPDDYQGGNIGFGCGSFEAPGSHCVFDDLTVSVPQEAGPALTLVFEDDFSDNSNNWPEFGVGQYGEYLAVQDGAYHLFAPRVIELPSNQILTIGNVHLTDFVLEAEAALLEGSADRSLIVVIVRECEDYTCTSYSKFNDYLFQYSGIGYVAATSTVDGEYSELQSPVLTEAVNQGAATNLIRLEVLDGTMTAYINGEQVLQVDLPGYQGGELAFSCEAFEAPYAHCTFDNLKVWELG